LGLDLKNMPNPPQYNLTYFLESGHMREGVVAVLIGFFERLTAAKIKKNSRTIIPNEEDFKKYLLPIAESLKNIVNYEDLIYLINTSGQGNRDQTIKRLCSVVKDAGYPEFDFDDLDDDLANIVDETKHIEKKLRETINQILSVGVGTDWCKGGKTDILPGKLENQLKENLHADIEINPQLVKQGRLYNGLTLGLSKDLILKHWDGFFANIFVVGGNKFTNKNQFDHALQHLGLYRNTDFHDMLSEEERQIIKRPDQKKLAQSYIKIFKTIFRDIEDSELVENSDDDENVEQSEASDQS